MPIVHTGGTSTGAPTGTWTDQVWTYWTNSTTTITMGTTTRVVVNSTDLSPFISEPTEERRQAAEERRREHQEFRQRLEQERQERLARRQAAKARGEELLRMVLLPDELRVYEDTDRIIVGGSDGRRYEINDGVVSNVEAMENGRRIAVLCCHPDLNPDGASDNMPYRDAHVAQVLQLRHDAKAFWDKANIDWEDLEAERQYHREHRVRPTGGNLAA